MALQRTPARSIPTKRVRLRAASPACEAPRASSLRLSAKRLTVPVRSTLEDSILGVWEDLIHGGRARCPVCAGEMGASGGCGSCGSELS